jgi:hypothetical protein
MATIEVEGAKYKVTENLGHQGGHYARAVETETGERIAVKRGGVWTWWTARDRLQTGGPCVGQSANAGGEGRGASPRTSPPPCS